MTKSEKRIEWKTRFNAWKASDLSVAQWCREEGIKDHQMYYWIRRFEDDKESKSEVQWLAVDMESEPTTCIGDESIFIHVGPLVIIVFAAHEQHRKVMPYWHLGVLQQAVQ